MGLSAALQLSTDTGFVVGGTDRKRTVSLKDVPFELIRAGLVTTPARPRRNHAHSPQLHLRWEKQQADAGSAGRS